MGQFTVNSILYPATEKHLGTSNDAPHEFLENLVLPVSVTPQIADLLMPTSAGGKFYAKLYEIPNAMPRYYGVAFRYGITDIGTVNVFFHPSTANYRWTEMTPKDYIGLAGGWSPLFRYVQYFGVQLAAATANMVWVMPMIDSDVWPDLGTLRSSFADIMNTILVEVQKVAWPDAPGQTMDRNQTALQTVILSAFSAGRIAMGGARNVAAISNLLREIWDFDGHGGPPPAAPRGGQALLYNQDSSPGGPTLFHVPNPRWVRFSFYSPGKDMHQDIPQRLGYHAATKSAFGH
jgi:hypothetical protein